jgi:hypothetical protein
MDGMQIFRLGNMCDALCGLAAQILALTLALAYPSLPDPVFFPSCEKLDWG